MAKNDYTSMYFKASAAVSGLTGVIEAHAEHARDNRNYSFAIELYNDIIRVHKEHKPITSSKDWIKEYKSKIDECYKEWKHSREN